MHPEHPDLDRLHTDLHRLKHRLPNHLPVAEFEEHIVYPAYIILCDPGADSIPGCRRFETKFAQIETGNLIGNWLHKRVLAIGNSVQPLFRIGLLFKINK